MEQKIKEFVLRYNYTLNPLGVYEAVKFMYTYWPDPNNVTHIRDQYIHVSLKLEKEISKLKCSKVSFTLSDAVRLSDSCTN